MARNKQKAQREYGRKPRRHNYITCVATVFSAIGCCASAILFIIFPSQKRTYMSNTRKFFVSVERIPYRACCTLRGRNNALEKQVKQPSVIDGCFVLNNNLRYEGKAFYAMFGLTAGGLLNILGDYILVMKCGLGVYGAGLATAASQVVSFGILLYMYLKMESSLLLLV